MRWIQRLGLVALGFFALGCGDSGPPTGEAARAAAKLLSGPDFELLDVEGKLHHLSDYRGRVLLLNFWATWCTSCRGEMPELEALAAEFAQRQVAIVGISVDKEVEKVAPYLAELGVTYPVLLDPDSVSGRLFGGIEGYPMTYVFDREGLIYSSYLGAQEKNVFEQDLRYLLDAEPSAGERLPEGTQPRSR